MRRLAFARPLVLLLAIWSLVSCGSSSPSHLVGVDQPEALVPSSATPSLSTTAGPVASPTATAVPALSATHTTAPTVISISSATFTSSPAPTWTVAAQPTPTPTPTPTALPPTPIVGEPLPLQLRWRFDSGGHLVDGAIASGDSVPLFVVGSLDRNVYALTGKGQIMWRARAAGPIHSLAVLSQGSVAVGDDAGYVTLLDGRGYEIWRYGLSSRVTALHGLWRGKLLAGGWDERLTVLNAVAGDEQVYWQADVGGPVVDLVTLSDLALVATASGELVAFDPFGNEIGRFDAGAPIVGLDVLRTAASELILVGVQDGCIEALRANSGSFERQWRHCLGVGGPVWHTITGDGASPVIVAGTGGEMPVLVALTPVGDLVWRLAPTAAVRAVAGADLDGDDEEEIVVGLASGEVQVFDRQGQLRGSVHAGLPVWGLDASEDGSVLVLADVVAWRIDSGVGPMGESWLPAPGVVPLALDVLDSGRAFGGDGVDAEAQLAQGQATLVFLGDVVLGRSMERQLIRFGPAYPWEGLGVLLREADLAAANLECVLTTQGQPLNKPYLMRAHPQWGGALIRADLDLVSLANNHALDFGQVGLDETLVTLENLGIASVGAGPSGDAAQARRPAVSKLNGVQVAVLGYAAARWNGSADVPETAHVAWAEPESIQADIRGVRDEVDVVVVLLHAGTEYATKPSADQVLAAHAAVDAGADLVVGHHPHVTQTVERYKRGLIVYSLGDALFDIPRRAAMQGHLLRVLVTREGLAQAELWPFWIEDAIRPRLLDDGQGGPRVWSVYP